MLLIIGKGNLIKVIVLIIVCLAIWMAAFSMIKPHYDSVKYDFSVAKGKTEEFNSDISKMERIALLMNDRGSEYKSIADRGVTKIQDRVIARRVIQDIKFSTDIPLMQYRISEEKEQKDDVINGKGYKLSTSELGFTLKSYTSHDIFHFIESLKSRFDGHIVLKSMELTKSENIGFDNVGGIDGGFGARAVEKNLATELLYPRIDANLIFVWNSLEEAQINTAQEDMFGATDF